jgi:CheY-like chemotaxis protein
MQNQTKLPVADTTECSVLIVDDDPLNRQFVSQRLSREGYVTAMASGGEVALEMMEHQRFNIVLIDLEMPGMDGLDTLKRIRANSSWSGTTVIMLSAYNDKSSIEQCLSAGAADFLVKPLVMPLVRNRIERFLQPITAPRAQAGAAVESPHHARILVVDDNELICRLISEQLGNRGYVVFSATSGEEAVKKLSNEPVDLVLLDVNMPGMAGTDVLKRIRGENATRRLPVIMVTGVHDVATMLSCIDYGVDGYITKPINFAALHNSIASSIGFRKTGASVDLG